LNCVPGSEVLERFQVDRGSYYVFISRRGTVLEERRNFPRAPEQGANYAGAPLLNTAEAQLYWSVAGPRDWMSGWQRFGRKTRKPLFWPLAGRKSRSGRSPGAPDTAPTTPRGGTLRDRRFSQRCPELGKSCRPRRHGCGGTGSGLNGFALDIPEQPISSPEAF
jgi:hypothetical protein